MADLAQWLHSQSVQLVQAATTQLSPDEILRATMQPTVASFYGALIYTAESGSFTLLHAVLINWARSRSTLAESDHAEESGLLPIIATLKRVMLIKIGETSPNNAIELFLAADNLFNEANQYAARLENEAVVVEGQRKLEVVQESVGRLDKSKSDFIAVAAHELKTPLTLIEGYSNMLRAEFSEADHPRALLMVNGIAGGTARLREIVEDMIDVSLIDLKLLNLHYQPVWLHRMIDIVGFDLAEPMRQRNVKFVVNRSDLTDKPTYADSERLYQAIHKIISNAIKYTPDGGTISVSSRELPGFTDLQIRDTGIGIAPENLSRIFEKFSTMGDVALHSSGKVKFKGAGPGLGLAIAKGFLEAHGGSIWAESPGFDEKSMPGSTFHIMIPMRSAPPDDQMSALFKEKSGTTIVVKAPTNG